jgi:hypothetical protein
MSLRIGGIAFFEPMMASAISRASIPFKACLRASFQIVNSSLAAFAVVHARPAMPNGQELDTMPRLAKDWKKNYQNSGAPKGNRTPVFAVKGRRPRPLDDGRGSCVRKIESIATPPPDI